MADEKIVRMEYVDGGPGVAPLILTTKKAEPEQEGFAGHLQDEPAPASISEVFERATGLEARLIRNEKEMAAIRQRMDAVVDDSKRLTWLLAKAQCEVEVHSITYSVGDRETIDRLMSEESKQ